jgi:hypothetical protein
MSNGGEAKGGSGPAPAPSGSARGGTGSAKKNDAVSAYMKCGICLEVLHRAVSLLPCQLDSKDRLPDEALRARKRHRLAEEDESEEDSPEEDFSEEDDDDEGGIGVMLILGAMQGHPESMKENGQNLLDPLNPIHHGSSILILCHWQPHPLWRPEPSHLA